MRRLKAGILFLAGGLAAAPSFAQTPDPAQLKVLERELKQSESESQRLAGEAAAATREVERLRRQAIDLAREIQDQEYSLLVMENRIAEMEADAAEKGRTLERRDVQMREALLALQRLALRPADALALNPLSPDDAVRTAILLRAAMPNIRQSSSALAGELAALYRVRAQVVEQREAAAAGAAALIEKRKRMETTIAERAAQQQKIALRSGEATARTQKLAQEAEDLRALFAKLAEEKARREAAERKIAAEKAAAEKAQREKALADAKAKADKPAEVEAARVAPSPPQVSPDEVAVTRSFGKARGTLPFPVAGTLSAKFGEAADPTDSAGLRTKGITIKAPAGAQVIAPFDGVIAFAGPFRGYGQLLIIEHSEGYHTLLAGLGRIDGDVGSRVLAGEPVGVMASAVSDDAPASSLYVELRRDGQPINPLPWLADRTGKVASR